MTTGTFIIIIAQRLCGSTKTCGGDAELAGKFLPATRLAELLWYWQT